MKTRSNTPLLMKKWLMLVLSLVLALSASVVGWSSQAEAAGATIDTAKLKSISRLYFPIRDDRQQLYTLYLFANNEKRTVTSADNAWAGASAGDVIYAGKYQAALVKSGQKTGRVQAVNLNYTTLNATRNTSFRLPGDGKTRPDLLFLSETASSNANEVRAFVITNGVLHSLDFASETGVKWGKEGYVGSGGNSLRGLSGNRIQTRNYNNAVGQYYFSTYKLNLKGLKFQHIDSLYRPSQAWPTTQGSHAFLDALKKSALKHELPANPKVKMGMTEKQVRAIMGKPNRLENGEWSGFLNYGRSSIGFNEYVYQQKLPAGARVWEFVRRLDDQHLEASQVVEWLGEPTDSYFSEGDGGYVLVYEWNDAGLSFWYEDEYSPMYSYTIY